MAKKTSKKKTINDNGGTVWQYVFVDQYNRVEISSSRFLTVKAATTHFDLLTSQGNLKKCKLIGFQPTYQSIYN